MINLQSNVELVHFLHSLSRLQRGEERRLTWLVISIEIYLIARVGWSMVVLEELYWYCLIRNIKAWRKTIISDFLISSPYKALYHKMFIRNIRNKKKSKLIRIHWIEKMNISSQNSKNSRDSCYERGRDWENTNVIIVASLLLQSGKQEAGSGGGGREGGEGGVLKLELVGSHTTTTTTRHQHGPLLANRSMVKWLFINNSRPCFQTNLTQCPGSISK